MIKKKKIEVFDMITGKWKEELLTQEEINKMKKLDESEYDILRAEFDIIQRSIEMELDMFDNKQSTD